MLDDDVVVMERGGNSVAPFLAGLVLGAAVALLLAPESGEETRARLRRTARRAKRIAGDYADDLADRGTELWRDARDAVDARLDAAREAIGERGRRVARAVENGRDAARQARADIERRIADAAGGSDTD
jgi:gas vesicle protein